MKTGRTFRNAGLLVALALFVLAAPAPRAEQQKEGEARPLVILSGPDSRVAERGYFRIRDREAWVDLWLRHAGLPREKHSDYYNPARIPDVDFARAEVVAILQGASVNSAGVDFVEALRTDEGTVLRFDDRSYQTMDGADACTAYGFFILARTDRRIILSENVQGLLGHPPEWKERARLD